MVCDRDCFHCKYEDCILDELTAEEYKSDEVEKFISEKPTIAQIRNRNHMRQLRAENPNYNKDYYIRHRESEIKRVDEWKKDNKEYVKVYQRERYAKNREEMCRKRREYRARKKVELNGKENITVQTK